MLTWNFAYEIKSKINSYGLTDVEYIYYTKK